MSLFLCLFRISLGQYCQKNVVKVGCLEKRNEGADGHIDGAVHRRGSSNLLHTMLLIKYKNFYQKQTPAN